MKFPSREMVEMVRRQYPVGTRVELTQMTDVQAPPIGTKGTVTGVDGTASIMVNWDNGSGLHVLYGEDKCRKLKTVKTICYGEEEVWDSRRKAAAFFLKAMAGSEGGEQQRYTKIYTALMMGNSVCTDEEESS